MIRQATLACAFVASLLLNADARASTMLGLGVKYPTVTVWTVTTKYDLASHTLTATAVKKLSTEYLSAADPGRDFKANFTLTAPIDPLTGRPTAGTTMSLSDGTNVLFNDTQLLAFSDDANNRLFEFMFKKGTGSLETMPANTYPFTGVKLLANQLVDPTVVGLDIGPSSRNWWDYSWTMKGKADVFATPLPTAAAGLWVLGGGIAGYRRFARRSHPRVPADH